MKPMQQRRGTLLRVCLPLFIVLVGCSEKDARVRLSFHADPLENTDLSLRMVLHDDDGARTTINLGSSPESVGPFDTKNSGRMTIDFQLLANGKPQSTAGTLELPLKEDWIWGVDFFIREEDPLGICFGCEGSREYELDETLGYPPEEKLYAVWGGNSISNPVVY
jgi:hypothetical protein